MSNEERGLFITLLCRQWTQGHVTPDEVARLGSTMAQPSLNHVLTKFEPGADSNLRNPRLEGERVKQNAFRALQSEKGKASARARSNHGSTQPPTAVQPGGAPKLNSPSPSPSPSPLQEREQGEHGDLNHGSTPVQAGSSQNVNPPSLQEVLTRATFMGLAAWKAEDWFNEMESCGWLDFQHRPVVKWQPLLNRVKSKWEADGRPSGPPAGKQPGARASGSQPSTPPVKGKEVKFE